jgi:hypothetical protein
LKFACGTHNLAAERTGAAVCGTISSMSQRGTTRMHKRKRSALSGAGRVRQPREAPSSRMEAAQLLNIDLDVRSRRSLAPLVTAWPWAYQPLATGGPPSPNPRWLLLNARGAGKTAEAIAEHLLLHIEQLRGDARQCWKNAHRRVFDIGVQAGGPGRAYEDVRLTAETLRRIAAADAQIQLTIYPAVPESGVVIPASIATRKQR